MTLQEIYDNIDSFSDEERGKYLKNVIEILTPISKQTLMSFQLFWNPEKGNFDIFKKEQDKLFRNCINLEISQLGDMVRKDFNLKILRMTDKIKGN